MAATEATGGGFLRKALHNRRLAGSPEEIQADLGADGDAAVSREREPEAARA